MEPCTQCKGSGSCSVCMGTGISHYGNCNGQRKSFGCTSCWNPGEAGGACSGGSAGDGKCSACEGTGEGPSSITDESEARNKKIAEAKAKKAQAEAEANEKRKKEEADKTKRAKEVVERMKGSSTGLNEPLLVDDSSTPVIVTDTKNKSGKANPPEVKSLKGPMDARVSPQLLKYSKEINEIKVPLSWDNILQSRVDSLRTEQDKKEKYFIASDGMIDVFDLAGKTSAGMKLTCKVILKVFVKPGSAAMDEAEILIFKDNATCEKALSLLRDSVKGPQLSSILHSLKENKALPEKVDTGLLGFAKALLNPAHGNTGSQIAWSALLSKEAKSAYLNEAIKGSAELVNTGLRGKAVMEAQNRFAALKNVNDKILEGEKYLKTASPFEAAFIEHQLKVLNGKLGPFDKVPKAIYNMVSYYDKFKGTQKSNSGEN